MSSRLNKPPALRSTQCCGLVLLPPCFSEAPSGLDSSTKAMSWSGWPTDMIDNSLTTARPYNWQIVGLLPVFGNILGSELAVNARNALDIRYTWPKIAQCAQGSQQDEVTQLIRMLSSTTKSWAFFGCQDRQANQ